MLFRSPIPPGKWFSAVFNGFFLFFPDFSRVKKENPYTHGRERNDKTDFKILAFFQ